LVQIDIRLADCVQACRTVEPSKRPSFKDITLLLDQVKLDLVQKGGFNSYE
jgi:hypothetical protein